MQAEPILSATEASIGINSSTVYMAMRKVLSTSLLCISVTGWLLPRAVQELCLTSSELAARTGAQERYVREWLEQQAAACVLEVADITAGLANAGIPLSGTGGGAGRSGQPDFIAPLAQLIAGAVSPLDQLLELTGMAAGCRSVPMAPTCAKARPV